MSSSGWIARSNLRELAESPEADALLLSRAAIAYNRRKYEHGKPRKPYAQMLEELVRSCLLGRALSPGQSR